MKIHVVVTLLLLACLAAAPVVRGEELSVKTGDTMQKILEDRKGKRVTLRLQGAEELTGKVRTVTRELVQLGELSGREYFDAVVDVSKISSIIVRVKE